ncbi:MAG: hypothetical protein WC231_01260 [Dehalococcoidales bacterium]|jgi:hypothetical protein
MSIVEEAQPDENTKPRGAVTATDKSSAHTSKDDTPKSEPKDRVEQVREILFGAQREEYDRRFGELEELIAKSISDINGETTRKNNALRNDYDKRLARLEELLISNISELSNDTSSKIENINNKLEVVRGEKVDKIAVSKLLEQILNMSQELDVSSVDDVSYER